MTAKKIPPADGSRQGGDGLGSSGRGISDSKHSTDSFQTQQTILALSSAGVEFTLPKWGDKQPYTVGWPKYRPDLATVGEHLAHPGNLGVHVKGYTDGRILAYFDGDDGAGIDALLRVAPALFDSLRSWRANGSGKVFFWIDDPDGLLRNQATPNLSGEHSKREFKISGQAAIAGLHPSGEQYQTNWAAPITLSLIHISEPTRPY